MIHNDQTKLFKMGLELIAIIGKCSDCSLGDAESFMSDVAYFALGRMDQVDDQTWTISDYEKQIITRFTEKKKDEQFVKNFFKLANDLHLKN